MNMSALEYWWREATGALYDYFFYASIVFVLFYVILRKPLWYRKVQKKMPKLSDYGRDIMYSIISVTIFATVALTTFRFLGEYVNTYKEIEEYGMVYYIFTWVYMFFIHDTYFYWMHRMMHMPQLFKHVHLVHHKSTNPSPWTAYAFHPFEAFPSRNEWDAIIEIARKQGVYLYADEMYRLLSHEQTEEIPAACDLYEKAISLWGMAKSFGMAGLRIGWLASQDKSILKQVLSFKDYLSICNSAPSEILALIGLRHNAHFLNINLTKIQQNIARFKDFQQKHVKLISFVPPKAGSTAFAQLHIKESSLDFSEKLVQKAGIMALPAEMFEFGKKHIRVGFGRENFPEILEVLDGYLIDNY